MTGTIFHVHITAKIICFYSSGFGELDFPQKNMSMAAFLTSSLPLSAFPPYGSEGRKGKEEKKVQGRRRWREKKAFFSSFSILPPPSFVLLQRRERERAYSLHTEHPELERVRAKEERKQGRK